MMGRMVDLHSVQDYQEVEDVDDQEDGDEGDDGTPITEQNIPDNSWVI